MAASTDKPDSSLPKPLKSAFGLNGSELVFYKPDPEQLAFFKSVTGIDDDEQLKAHIIEVQHEAYKVHAYPCIGDFSFIKLRLSRLPGYDQLLQLGQGRENAVYLDVGCCFGSDLRKAIVDGYPTDNVIATDVVPEFWTLGHKLFKTTPETFPVPFLAGDAFDAAFLAPASPSYAPAPAPTPEELRALTSLSPLHGRVSAISVCNVFHLFASESAQAQLARAIAGLLNAEPGSLVIGVHAGRPDAGATVEIGKGGREVPMFYHSPESWAALWDGEIFEKGAVKVEARLVLMGDISAAIKKQFWFMEWVVTRL